MSIFPLSLTPSEHLFLANDSPSYPATFWVSGDFSGIFERTLFTKAVVQALERHPLLRAHIRGSAQEKTRDIAWIEAKNTRPYIDWSSEDKPLLLPNGEWINLKKETGLRIFMREKEGRTRLLMQVHHACCDGLRSSIFMDDVFTVYAKLYSKDTDLSLSPINHDSLLKRHKYKFNKFKRILMFPKNINRITKMLGKRVSKIAIPTNNQPKEFNNDNIPVYCSHIFSQSETLMVLKAAKEKSVTLNDLLIRDLFLTIYEWNQKNEGLNNRNLRIGVPVNMSSLLQESSL